MSAPPRRRTVRSKDGCATCRKRKVKCDETKPVCRQCCRLGLQCEGYARKLLFRDYTTRVKERMASVVVMLGNPVFDPCAEAAAAARRRLPPMLRAPAAAGTLPPPLSPASAHSASSPDEYPYNVQYSMARVDILTPRNFAAREEYAVDDDDDDDDDDVLDDDDDDEQRDGPATPGRKRRRRRTAEAPASPRVTLARAPRGRPPAAAAPDAAGSPTFLSVPRAASPPRKRRVSFTLQELYHPEDTDPPFKKSVSPVSVAAESPAAGDGNDDDAAMLGGDVSQVSLEMLNDSFSLFDQDSVERSKACIGTILTMAANGQLNASSIPMKLLAGSPAGSPAPPLPLRSTGSSGTASDGEGDDGMLQTAVLSAAAFASPGLTTTDTVPSSLPDIAPLGIQVAADRRFLHHYVNVVSARMIAPDRGKNNPFTTVFAHLSASHPPLLHAILAVSAQDVSRFESRLPFEAFVHYQRASRLLFENLSSRTTDVGSFDQGLLATACLLCAFEVTAPEGETWKTHLDGALQILRLMTPKGRNTSRERFYRDGTFLTWWWATLDIQHALFDRRGGRIIEYLLDNDLVPPSGQGKSYPQIEKTEDERREFPFLSPMLQFSQKLYLTQYEIARVSHMRLAKAAGEPFDQRAYDAALDGVMVTMQHLWDEDCPGLCHDLKTYRCADQVWRTKWKRGIPVAQHCLSRMYSLELTLHLLEPTRVPNTVVQRCIREIQVMVDDILEFDDVTGRRFILYPMFAAIIAADSFADKQWLLTQLRRMENSNVGSTFVRTRRVLQLIVDRQAERIVHGLPMLLDWTELAKLSSPMPLF